MACASSYGSGSRVGRTCGVNRGKKTITIKEQENPHETVVFGAQANAALSQFIRDELLRQVLPMVPVKQHIDAALGAAGRDGQQTLGGDIGEVGRKIGDNRAPRFSRQQNHAATAKPSIVRPKPQ